MNRKFWTAFAAVYAVTLAIDNLLKVLMWNFYPDLPLHILRPRAEMKLLLCPVGFLFTSFFLTLIFSKLSRGQGIGEGIRYAMYVNLMVNPLIALGFYAFLPISFALSINWFLSRTVLLLAVGAVLGRAFRDAAEAAGEAQLVAA